MNCKSEKQKEDIKLSIYLNHSCSLHAEYLCYIRKCFNKYTASFGVICFTLIKITFLKLVFVTNITYKHFV